MYNFTSQNITNEIRLKTWKSIKPNQNHVKSVQLVKITQPEPILYFYIKIKTVAKCWVSTPLSPFPWVPTPRLPLHPSPFLLFLSPFPKLKDQRRKCWIWVTTIFMTFGVSITSAVIIGLRPLETKEIGSAQETYLIFLFKYEFVFLNIL